MKNYLSFKETNFLSNPQNFNNNYRYVLTHRIKQKQKAIENTLSMIKKHERTLLTDKEKIDYDENKAFEQKQKEYWRKMGNPRAVFIPNIQQRAKNIEHTIRTLQGGIASFKLSLKKQAMTDPVKEQAKNYIGLLKKEVDDCFNELESIFIF